MSTSQCDISPGSGYQMHLVDKGFDVGKGWPTGAEKRGQGWKINVARARALLPRLGADFLQWGSG